MSNSPTLQIPKDVIEPIIQANITAAIAQALSGGQSAQLISNTITQILRMTVDSEGKPSSYSGSKPWIDWAIGSAVRSAALAAINEQVELLKDRMKAHIAAELTKKNSPLHKQLAEGLVNGVFSTESLKWRLTIAPEAR